MEKIVYLCANKYIIVEFYTCKMRKFIEFFKRDRFAVMAGAELLEVREGYAKARMLITSQHLNGGDVCQGGALFTLADLAFAAAVNSHLKLTFSTTSSITFVRSVAKGYVYAEANEIVNHHRMPFGEVRITDEQGNLVAVFTSSGYRKDIHIDTLQA